MNLARLRKLEGRAAELDAARRRREEEAQRKHIDVADQEIADLLWRMHELTRPYPPPDVAALTPAQRAEAVRDVVRRIDERAEELERQKDTAKAAVSVGSAA